MPIYTYKCSEGHEADQVQHRDIVVVPCACGLAARRQSVYRLAITGLAETPRDERSYRQSYGEYQDALNDVAYHWNNAKASGDPVREPDYYAAARAQAIAKGAPIL